MRTTSLLLIAPLLATACGRSTGSAACGISSLAGPVMILDQFSVPGRSLSEAPRVLPEEIAVRVAAGPVVRGLVGRSDSLLIIGVDEPIPATPIPGFGVLITSMEGVARGVVLFEGAPIADAPILGSVHTGNLAIPLLGLRADPRSIEDARCPLFPTPATR